MRSSSPIQGDVAAMRGGDTVAKGMRDGRKYPLSVGEKHTKRTCRDAATTGIITRQPWHLTCTFVFPFHVFFWPDHRGKNFNEALLKGLSGELPDIVLVKRAPPPKSAHSKVCSEV